MGRNGRDASDTHATEKHQHSTPLEVERAGSASTNSPNHHEISPDPRRRILIAGLATAPILLTLMNRSALAQDVNCSALASVILGGSLANLPPGLGGGEGGLNNNVPEQALQNYYDAKCKDEGNGGNVSSGSSTGSSSGNPTGNSNH